MGLQIIRQMVDVMQHDEIQKQGLMLQQYDE